MLRTVPTQIRDGYRNLILLSHAYATIPTVIVLIASTIVALLGYTLRRQTKKSETITSTLAETPMEPGSPPTPRRPEHIVVTSPRITQATNHRRRSTLEGLRSLSLPQFDPYAHFVKLLDDEFVSTSQCCDKHPLMCL